MTWSRTGYQGHRENFLYGLLSNIHHKYFFFSILPLWLVQRGKARTIHLRGLLALRWEELKPRLEVAPWGPPLKAPVGGAAAQGMGSHVLSVPTSPIPSCAELQLPKNGETFRNPSRVGQWNCRDALAAETERMQRSPNMNKWINEYEIWINIFPFFSSLGTDAQKCNTPP